MLLLMLLVVVAVVIVDVADVHVSPNLAVVVVASPPIANVVVVMMPMLYDTLYKNSRLNGVYRKLVFLPRSTSIG